MKPLLLLLFFQMFLCNLSFSQSLVKEDTLYVESVDFNTQTFSQIPCESFATNFKDRLKFKAISNGDTLSILNRFLGEKKYVRETRSIDVRAKFIYQRVREPTVTICTNGYEIL